MAEPEYNIESDVKNKTPSRMKLGAESAPSLKMNRGVIDQETKRELKAPYNRATYQAMSLDNTIASALGLVEILVGRSEWEAKAPSEAPKEEHDRAEYIAWMMSNMKREWSDYIGEILGYLIWGHQPAEKVYTRVNSGEYKGNISLKDLRFISPTTIDAWIYKKESGDLAGLRQSTSHISQDFKKEGNSSYIDVPKNKFMLFRYAPKLDNPEGTSPLRACYIPWKQKVNIESFMMIGVARDLSGLPHIKVDAEFLSRASVAGSDEEETLNEMKRQAAGIHNSEQSYLISPVAYDDSGKELFGFELLGVTGSVGKSFDLEAIINRLDSKILLTFLADILKLGTDGNSGSYALSDSKISLLETGVEQHLSLIKKELNHNLMRQLYVLNGWEYNYKTSAKFEYSPVSKPSLDELSKFYQRVTSVGLIRPSKEIEDSLYEAVNLEPMKDEDITFIETEATSRAGEGNGTSGTGKNIQDNSDSNNENSASTPSGFREVTLQSGKRVLVIEEDYPDWEDLDIS